jgi:uncharacterized protein YhbP (UPF0306 family)
MIERNRYLVLGTTNGTEPWVAPLEYLADEDLNLFFFSTEGARHVGHIEANSNVAVTIFDFEQPAYTPGMTAKLNGVQIECTATKLERAEYTDMLLEVIEFGLPMPPYEAMKLTPTRFYAARIDDGINVRHEVEMG